MEPQQTLDLRGGQIPGAPAQKIATENVLGIKNPAILKEFETRSVTHRLLEQKLTAGMFQNSAQALGKLHQDLYQDVYKDAGQFVERVRTDPQTNQVVRSALDTKMLDKMLRDASSLIVREHASMEDFGKQGARVLKNLTQAQLFSQGNRVTAYTWLGRMAENAGVVLDSPALDNPQVSAQWKTAYDAIAKGQPEASRGMQELSELLGKSAHPEIAATYRDAIRYNDRATAINKFPDLEPVFKKLDEREEHFHPQGQGRTTLNRSSGDADKPAQNTQSARGPAEMNQTEQRVFNALSKGLHKDGAWDEVLNGLTGLRTIGQHDPRPVDSPTARAAESHAVGVDESLTAKHQGAQGPVAASKLLSRTDIRASQPHAPAPNTTHPKNRDHSTDSRQGSQSASSSRSNQTNEHPRAGDHASSDSNINGKALNGASHQSSSDQYRARSRGR